MAFLKRDTMRNPRKPPDNLGRWVWRDIGTGPMWHRYTPEPRTPPKGPSPSSALSKSSTCTCPCTCENKQRTNTIQ